jgi:rRNA-processing protein FCF1
MDEPYVLVVLDKTIDELNKICKGKTKDARAAQLGLALLNARLAANPTIWEKILGLVPHDKKERKVRVVKANKYVDDAIVEMADKNTIVATNDGGLKKRLKKKDIPVFTMRGKKQIILQ